MILDNNDRNEPWPIQFIEDTLETVNRLDKEPYAQYVLLKCGHWLINTYGNLFPEQITGGQLGCRACYKKE